MERTEVPTRVANFISATTRFADAPDAAMLYCRKAFECMIHTKFFDMNGKWPTPDEDGNFRSASSVIREIDEDLSRQTKETIWSINAQIRPSMHWSVETDLERGAETHHVDSVVSQIHVAYIDLFGSKLSLGVSSSDRSTIESTVRETVSVELSNTGVTIDSAPEAFELEEGELESILTAASAAEDLGFEFDPWDIVRLGNAHVMKGQYESAAEHYERAIGELSESSEREDRKATACALKGLGNCNYAQGGRHDEAEKLYSESLRVSKEISYAEGMARGLGSLAIISSDRGDFLDSKRLYEEAVVFFEEIGDEEGLATALSNLSGILGMLGDTETGLTMLERAISINRRIGEENGTASCLHKLAERYHWEGDLEEAEELYNEALAIRRDIGDKRGECFTINSLGDLAVSKGDLEGATELYQISLEIAKEINLTAHVAHTKWDLGFVKMKEKDWGEARRLLNESMSDYESMGVFSMHSRILTRLADTALGEGEFELSEELHREAVRTYISQGIPITGWYAENGYVDPDADWEFPPPGSISSD